MTPTRPNDPALPPFLLQLSIDTRVNQPLFEEWVRANIEWLRSYAQAAGEPPDTPVEHTMSVWLRTQFKQRLWPEVSPSP